MRPLRGIKRPMEEGDTRKTQMGTQSTNIVRKEQKSQTGKESGDLRKGANRTGKIRLDMQQ